MKLSANPKNTYSSTAFIIKTINARKYSVPPAEHSIISQTAAKDFMREEQYLPEKPYMENPAPVRCVAAR